MAKTIVLLCALSLLAAAPPIPGSSQSLVASLRADLSRYLNSRGKTEHISAVSLSISLHNSSRNINVAAGTTEYGGRVPVTPGNLFQIGSNTKAFTAATLLQLEAAKKVNLNQTVGRWLPQYKNWQGVAIRQLLNMTSGIPTYDDQASLMGHLAKSPMTNFSAQQLVSTIYRLGGHAPPARPVWLYSNTAYIMSQMIIERVTGHSYASEIEQRFFHPLGLTDTYYEPNLYPPPILDRTVAGYFTNTDPDNASLKPILGKNVRDFSVSWAQGAGGIVSTPEDLTKWVRALYTGNILMPAQRRELMSIVSNKTGEAIATTTLNDPHGFGLGVGQATMKGVGTFWYYEGITLGYRMVYGYWPKQDAVIALALNSQPPSKQDHIGQLMQEVYSALQRAGKL